MTAKDTQGLSNSSASSVNGWQGPYLEAQYEQYKADPNSVPADLRSFFMGFELAGAPDSGMLISSGTRIPISGEASRFQAAVDALIAAYRKLGHFAAKLDPFGRTEPRPEPLSLAFHGLSEADLGHHVDVSLVGVEGSTSTLGELVAHLEATYCGTIGLEFVHIQNLREREWFLQKFEAKRGKREPSRQEKLRILELLSKSEGFERFAAKRYPTEKRFSLEGAESLIPMMDRMLEHATTAGVDEVVIGMAHRGRLNVLNTIMGKTYQQIFTEFEDNWEEGFADGGGDVKYHRGYSGVRKFPSGRQLHLAMASNPSHLESVNPVVEGRTRAKQRLKGDHERRSVLPLLIHGDAAIAGQGMVAECLNFSQLEGYTTGGTVHIVINNLIGFTTIPQDARSTRYCTDIAKAFDCPIFHVNGEDPDAMLTVAELVAEYRQTFRKDVFVDMLCYRKYGHNEQDEQSFTQPILAGMIKAKPSVLTTYSQTLLTDGTVSKEDFEAINTQLENALEEAQKAAKAKPHDPTIDPGSARWKGMGADYSHDPVETGVPLERLEEVCAALGRTPEGFNVNAKLKGLLHQRAEMPRKGRVSYADAEVLAFGTLLIDGIPVRLSGQDCRRGTFTQRHAVLRDAESGKPYTPLNNIREVGEPGTGREIGEKGADGKPRQAKLCVYDSPLSEVSVMGFDYGYSLADPNMLVCWEAQFGDFVNGAQVIIDQYLSCSEQKWDRWSGLVLLLPHGYEGAGPEHSSARLERFLQLCSDDNMQVIYPSTSAQIFHALRRQVRRNFRKPLIVMTPKSLLRKETSEFDEFVKGSFREVIDDPRFEVGPGASAKPADRKGVDSVLLCSGKIYWELADRRDELAKNSIAIVRVEQFYPLHTQLLKSILDRYPKSAKKTWVQEEPRNMAGYLFIRDLVQSQLGIDLPYIGRPASASPAVGSKHMHKHEQEDILEAAVGKVPPKPAAPGTQPEAKPAKGAKPDALPSRR
ncbi:MAG: 2-oxoglutarate dehydrogenase E1 component [Phycisphaeraceae bacterium]|nr:2-oxoglutarate dehydrogenase E1 component [Phycisphaeraceae bacterium]